MKRIIVILSFVTWLLCGCYDDKGNYDYKDINTIEGLTFDPVPEVVTEGTSYRYTYRQPIQEELSVTYSPVFSQSEVEGEENMEYLWVVSYREGNENVTDSVFTKELTLTYPVRKSSSYNVKFRLTDTKTGISAYRDFTMGTRLPFVHAWFVLNGEENNRKLSTVEDPDSTHAIITLDAYRETWDVERFQKASSLMFAGQVSNTRDMERLYVVQSDSASFMLPFALEDAKASRNLFAPGLNPTNLAYGVSHVLWRNAIVVDGAGKFYHSGASGFYFAGLAEDNVQNYVIDKIYMSQSGFVTVWDKVNRKFMSYRLNGMNGCYNFGVSEDIYPQEAVEYNLEKLTPFPVEGLQEVDKQGVTHNMEILWLGKGISVNSSEEGATAIGVMNDTCYLLKIEASSKGGKSAKADESPIKVVREKLGKLGFNGNTCFATTVAFMDQFLYTDESKVYLFNVVTKEKVELYDAGNVITRLKFRSDSEGDFQYESEPYRALGVVVNAGGQGELHEVVLSVGGDYVDSHVFTGFGVIKDVVYTAITRRLN